MNGKQQWQRFPLSWGHELTTILCYCVGITETYIFWYLFVGIYWMYGKFRLAGEVKTRKNGYSKNLDDIVAAHLYYAVVLYIFIVFSVPHFFFFLLFVKHHHWVVCVLVPWYFLGHGIFRFCSLCLSSVGSFFFFYLFVDVWKAIVINDKLCKLVKFTFCEAR